MTAPLISSLAAYMLATDSIIPMWQTMLWIVSIAVLGVLFAFPLKRRFINDEQHPFPEGRAAGIVMDSLHEGSGEEGMRQARLLAGLGGVSALVSVLKSAKITALLRLPFHLPEYADEWIYRLGWKPAIAGTSLKQLSIRPDTDIVMMAAGGLMGIRTGVSLMVGAILNYVFLAPWMIQRGDIVPKADHRTGVLLTDSLLGGDPVYGFKQITEWALWCGVAMMTTASLFAFFSKPRVILTSFAGLFRRTKPARDPLAHIELPMKVFVVGIPIAGGAAVYLAHAFFDVPVFLGILAIPLVFVFTLIGVNSTALTSITPTGALGKLTQLTYGVLSPGNIKTNLMTAGITGEVASNASNLLMDIKPGYMLGAKPRQQALGHVIGIFAGALAAVPVFYFAFLRHDPDNLITEEFAMPAATVWKSVAEALTLGLDKLPVSARWAALCGGLAGILMEAVRAGSRNRFWLSPVGVGLAFVISFHTCLAMFLGSFLFWLVARRAPGLRNPDDPEQVKNQEPICAGIIAGGALAGISVLLVENLLLS